VNLLHSTRFRLAAVFRRSRMNAEIDEELRSHIEIHADELEQLGLPRAEAQRRARIKFGGQARFREECHQALGGHFIETFLQDVRFGLRMLRKNPGFTTVAVLTLALGIGANTAIFSVVDSVMLRPLPFEKPGQLMVVWHTPPQKSFPGIPRFVVSPANFLDWNSENHVFSLMSAIGLRSANLTGLGRPESLQERKVSYDFFSLLGVPPIAGRGFTAGEDEAGRGNVAVLSYALCQNHFGTPKNALGKNIKLDENSYTVVGVMPPQFDFPFQAQLWTPLAWTDQERAVRGNHNYIVIARLAAGVDIAKAQAEMNTISSRLAQRYPTDDAGWGAVVLPLDSFVSGSIGPALLILLGAVGFVLLIACANVANLLLVKAMGRGKEIAIRTALGATGARVMRQVLSETALLAVIGGALALALAHFVIGGIAAFIGDQMPISLKIGLDGWVLGFTLVISILTGIIAGVAPAWHLRKVNLNESLKQGTGKRSADSAGRRARSALVVSEVAVSMVLLAGAGLTIRTLSALRNSNPGVDPHNVLTVPLAISETKYAAAAQQANFFEETLERVRALPGVVIAGAVDSLPFTGGSHQPVGVEGQPVVPMADQPEVDVRMISPGYLRAMRIPLEQGRDFSEADRGGTQPVVLVSEAFAKRFWPHEDPIGRHVTLTFLPGPSRVVVGVVGDVKLDGVDSAQPDQAVYYPMLQNIEAKRMTLAVRTSGQPTGLITAVTDTVHQIDPDEPVEGILTMDDVLDHSLTPQRLSVILLGVFAGLALLLAAIGIYGVQAYAVRNRVQEIGIRMALGARRGDVFRLVVGQGLKMTCIGICIGLGAAFGLTQLMRSLLFGVSASDPVTFVAVVIVLFAVAVAACWIPARKAMRVDPMAALRHE
jgi:putative ABC transport system permease protein